MRRLASGGVPASSAPQTTSTGSFSDGSWGTKSKFRIAAVQPRYPAGVVPTTVSRICLSRFGLLVLTARIHQPALDGDVGQRQQRLRLSDDLFAFLPDRGCARRGPWHRVAPHGGQQPRAVSSAKPGRSCRRWKGRYSGLSRDPARRARRRRRRRAGSWYRGRRPDRCRRGRACRCAGRGSRRPAAPALLGPHAAVGGERMGHAHDRRRFGTDQVIGDHPAVERKQHGASPWRTR